MMKDRKTETQEMRPDVENKLESVGITGLRTIVKTRWKDKHYKFIPEIDITIDLPAEKKGVHMSRLVESIIESVERYAAHEMESLEELGKCILDDLSERHIYTRGEIVMKSELVIPKRTPVTKKKTYETHDITVKLIKSIKNREISYRKIIGVEVVGNTACPHAMSVNAGKTHIQRAAGFLEIETDYDNTTLIEDMIDCVERAFSSEVYTLLKTEDESYVVNKMNSNPKFVEDVSREIIDNAKRKFKNCTINAKTVSYESIHRHNVVAKGVIEC